jgi:hypothetical protein
MPEVAAGQVTNPRSRSLCSALFTVARWHAARSAMVWWQGRIGRRRLARDQEFLGHRRLDQPIAKREYPPGTAAPVAGTYTGCNVFGAATGVRVRLQVNEALPTAPRAFTWWLVETEFGRGPSS